MLACCGCHLGIHCGLAGGPEEMEPKRKGYGSRIYWDLLSHEMRGSLDFEFAPDVFAAASNSPQGRSSKRSSDFVGPWGGETCDNVCQPCSAILARRRALASAIYAAKARPACSVRPATPSHNCVLSPGQGRARFVKAC